MWSLGFCLTNTAGRIGTVQKPDFCFLGYPATHGMLFHNTKRVVANENFLPNPEVEQGTFQNMEGGEETKFKGKQAPVCVWGGGKIEEKRMRGQGSER